MSLELLLAEREIARALARLARAMDERDWDAARDVLALDATADLGRGKLSSPDEIVAFIRQFLDKCGPTQHLLGNLLVEVDGDRATSRCYVSDLHLGPQGSGGPTFTSLGDYHDRWERRDGGWRLAHRIKHSHAFDGTLAVFGLGE